MKFLETIFVTIAIVLLTGAVFTHFLSTSVENKPLLVQNNCEIVEESIDEELCSSEDHLLLDSRTEFNDYFCADLFSQCIPYLYILSVSSVISYLIAAIFGHCHHKKKTSPKPSN